MTAKLTTKGRLVIPHDIRTKYGLRKGDDFHVLCSSNSDILLRPIRHLEKGWLKTLRAMRGLKLQRIEEPVRIAVLF